MCAEGNQFIWPVWMDELHERNRGVIMMKLPEEHRIRYLSAYNSKEPVTDDNPPNLYMFSHPRRTLLIIAGVEEGCVTLTQQVSIAEFRDILGPAEPPT